MRLSARKVSSSAGRIGASNRTADRRDDGAGDQAFGNGAKIDKDDVLVAEFGSQLLRIAAAATVVLPIPPDPTMLDETARSGGFAQTVDDGLPADQRTRWRWHTACGSECAVKRLAEGAAGPGRSRYRGDKL